MKKIFFYVLLLSGLFPTQSVVADTISWTGWTSAVIGIAGSATGTIQTDRGKNVVVSYKGDVAFAQLGSGINYWTEGVPKPYTGNSTIENAPSAANMIALSHPGITNTITFSRPVRNPIMAIVSLGAPWQSISYNFNSQFKILGKGQGYWGDGTYSILGNTLTGTELHGVIQFQGLISSIIWTVSYNEWWHGFTIGLPSNQTTLAPSLMLLLRPKK